MHERLEALRRAYEEIPVPKELGDMVDRLCSTRLRPRVNILWRIGAVAAVLVAFTVTLNAVPAMAATLEKVPVLGPVVRVLTFAQFRMDERGAHARVDIAEITGLENEALQEAINAELRADAEAFIAQFQQDVADVRARFGQQDAVHLAIETFHEVKCANDEVFSLQVEYFWAAGGSDTYYKFYNVDQRTGELLTLDALFADGADYLPVINEYLIAQMKAETREDGKSIYWVNDDDLEMDRFTGVDGTHNFYITEAGKLVIAFDKYEVAPGFVGTPAFEIPTELIAGLLAEDAPIH